MYKGEVTKPPLNYGFGVKQGDIFGVEDLSRKEGYNYASNNVVEVQNLKVALSVVKKQNEDLEHKNQIIVKKFDETTQIFRRLHLTFYKF